MTSGLCIKKLRRTTAFLFALLVVGIWLPALAEEAAVETPQALEQPVVEDPTADITVRSQEALAALDRIEAEIAQTDGGEKEAAQVELLREKVDDLLPEGETLDDLLDDPALIDGVRVRSRALSSQSGALIDRLTDSAKLLEAQRAELKQVISRWELVQEQATGLPEALSERVASILTTARELETLTSNKLNNVVELQNASMTLRNVITPIAERIDTYGKSQQVRLLEQNAAPLWNMTSEHISESSQRAGRSLFSTLRRDFASWTETADASIAAHLLLLPLILFLLLKLRGAAESEPTGALARPVPTGVLIWMLFGVMIYTGAPAAVRLTYAITGMLVAAVVLIHFLPKNMRPGVVLFAAIAIIEHLFSGLAVTDHLPRIAYLLLAVVLIGVAILGRWKGSLDAFRLWGAPGSLIAASVFTATILLGISVAANLFGYVHLAKFLLGGVIDSIAVFLILFAGLTSVTEVIEVLVGLPMLDHVRSVSANRYRLRMALKMPLVWLSLLLWLWMTARAFGIDGWLITAILGIFQAEMSVGTVTLSLRGVLVFVFAVWAAVWMSRIVRAVLNQDVLSRMDLPRGVPNTISMTAHYSIILMGLLLGVGFMGIDLSSLAFVVGALGVGIGFGMQNLVNNFVSGLILIFEAPIQVGDTVQVGTLMGKVVQIGIRTSRVRTFDGSEVIVPNGDLISNQVINWTLTDRRRRLELIVGVAYGTDPDLVTSILRGVLEAEEEVLKDPEPLVVFSAFGDSALNFRVLAWIADFDRSLGITHSLNTRINAALAAAGITIPFPQRDLHIVSMPGGDPAPGAESA